MGNVHRKGFTLIELLVVIAIIAILAAILFPVFVAAKESGRRARCVCQLKQIGAATMGYADDYSGYLPPYPSASCPDMLAVTVKLKKYAGNSDKVWLCPSDNGYKPWKIAPSFYVVYGASYQYNWYVYQPPLPRTVMARMISNCRTPTKLILYWDRVSHPTGMTQVQNTLFGDGHVTGLDSASLSKQVTLTVTLVN